MKEIQMYSQVTDPRVSLGEAEQPIQGHTAQHAHIIQTSRLARMGRLLYEWVNRRLGSLSVLTLCKAEGRHHLPLFLLLLIPT